MAKKPATKPKPAAAPAVDALTHTGANRLNTPTRETLRYASDDPHPPALYPRDPSLVPQLVWKGKDQQDAHPLTVPAVPVYVQEKVHPRAIIDDVLRQAKAGQPVADLFADFNGLDDLSKKLDFYQHTQHWTNRLILGDSLLVMASLAEKERLRGTVQCIYFDPPYGIKFGSNWQVSTRKRDVKDAKADDLSRQPEQIKAFRDTWELGIHSYLTYLRDRLTAARDLLTESGSCFVQIGDENVHRVRCLMDEVFGDINFVAQIVYRKTTGATVANLSNTVDYVLWYAKDKEHIKYRQSYVDKQIGGVGATRYDFVEIEGIRRPLKSCDEIDDKFTGRVFSHDNITSQSMGREKGDGAACWFDVALNGKVFKPSAQSRWKTNESGMESLRLANRLMAMGNTLGYVRFFDDFPVFPINSSWDDTVTSGFSDKKQYVVQTHPLVIQRCLLMTSDPGDLVLDPTCGGGTTAYVAEQWGRRWITIDTSRVALALARTRLMAARFPYYLPADSAAGRTKLRDLGRDVPTAPTGRLPDIRQGFVYKQVPHVTLKSIANNPDIREGLTREQIDAAIKKHADTETLYDQPYEDKGTVRVCGPFTVESLSPHRELPPVTGITPATESAPKPDPGNYLQLIFDNLRTAGVKGTVKGQRIGFASLDPYPGLYVHAEGQTDRGLCVRVSVGPELGTVGDEWIGKAALEALKGSGCDTLLVCGFAFEASVLEQTADLTKEKKFGRLTVLPVRINPDLAMFGGEVGEELLKKTGAGNLFSVFGEPDLSIDKQPDGRYTVAVNGVDVFDPATGEVRSGGTDDIACWFLDTAYDGASFFVRHAYFCGADKPYEKLRKALKAEVDEAAWEALYQTTSRPFPAPATGRVAVKVINHFGDEVLKVYPVGG